MNLKIRMDMKTITDFDRGYWIAVQNAASCDFRSDKQLVKGLIREAGFGREACLKLMEESDFNADLLRVIVDEIYPEA